METRLALLRPQLKRVNADVLRLQEINAQENELGRTFDSLDKLLQDTPFATFERHTTVTTGGDPYDQRNLVTLSRNGFDEDAEIVRPSDAPRPSYRVATQIPPDDGADVVDWERPFLYSKVKLVDDRTLHLINLHMKSKIASSIGGQKLDRFTWKSVSAWAEGSFISLMKRMGQALQVRLLVDRLLDQHGDDVPIAVCGDFNAESDEVPVKAIRGHVEETGNSQHTQRVLIPCENNIPESARYSLIHLGHGEMIDHVIVSRPMLAYFDHTEIHNEALTDESGAFRGDLKFPGSDHAAVIAEFELR